MLNAISADIKELLTRNVEDVIVREHLEHALNSEKKLRIKYGIDPTTSELHLGYGTVLNKLRAFQELGHIVVFLIGDFTARFGDPTGKGETRAIRGKSEVHKHVRAWKTQVLRVLDTRRTEFRKNGEWYNAMRVEEFLRMISYFTASRMFERDMFQKRLKEGKAVFLHELLYPALQAYDSVMLKSNLTVIGSDQLFNEMQARALQEAMGQEPQDILTLEILPGLDGKRKMSQSYGNTIGMFEDPDEQFGKIMSLSDDLIIPYFIKATTIPLNDIREKEAALRSKKLHPKDAKIALASAVVQQYHGEHAAKRAGERFTALFQKGATPPDIKAIRTRPGLLREILVCHGIVASGSEFRRLVGDGAIETDGNTAHLYDRVEKTTTVRVGKKRFVRLVM